MSEDELAESEIPVPVERIQRKRSNGWRKPANTVIVDRTSVWGNPFPCAPDGASRSAVVERYRRWLTEDPHGNQIAVAARAQLAGKNLACSCPDSPCHADVLLTVANPELPSDMPMPPITPDLTSAPTLRYALEMPGIAPVRALSIRRPWAGLIATGHKGVENRTWSTRHRGWIVLHGSQAWEPPGAALADEIGIPVAPEEHLPGYVGAAFMEDVHHADACGGCSPWSEAGVYHWVFRDPIAWPAAVPGRGALGLRRLHAHQLQLQG